MNKLNYGHGAPKLPDNQFKISPSSAVKFFGYSASWFDEQFLGINKFEGNNASIRGTMLHWLAECYAKNDIITEEDIKEMNAYLDIQLENEFLGLSRDEIEFDLKNMWAILKQWIINNPLDSTEQYISAQLTPNVVLSGQVDYTRTNEHGEFIIGDYKSTGAKLMPKEPSYAHWFQAEIYATIMQLNGTTVDMTEINYIKSLVPGTLGKPNAKGIAKLGKEYPTEQVTYSRPFTNDDYTKKLGQMMNIAETMQTLFDQPNLAPYLFHNQLLKDMKLDVAKYKSPSTSSD